MEYTVKQVSQMCGVSVRTLHYYHEIGLLTPYKVTDSRYRLYNRENLERLQQILFFRELGFELAKIKEILDCPDFDKTEAMKKHRQLLMLKRNRLDRLIALVDKTLKGDTDMSFEEFDMSEIERHQKQYQEEAQQRWGHTETYKQSMKRASKYTKQDWARIAADSDRIYKSLAQNMDKDPSHPTVQDLIAQWQQHITENYYNCDKNILSCLGQMYVEDQRFTENIDKYGKGLAHFMSKAIEIYCSK